MNLISLKISPRGRSQKSRKFPRDSHFQGWGEYKLPEQTPQPLIAPTVSQFFHLFLSGIFTTVCPWIWEPTTKMKFWEVKQGVIVIRCFSLVGSIWFQSNCPKECHSFWTTENSTIHGHHPNLLGGGVFLVNCWWNCNKMSSSTNRINLRRIYLLATSENLVS